jgi:hypothetical protein
MGRGGGRIAARLASEAPQRQHLDGIQDEGDPGAREPAGVQSALPGLALGIGPLPRRVPGCVSWARRKPWAKAVARLRRAAGGRARGDRVQRGGTSVRWLAVPLAGGAAGWRCETSARPGAPPAWRASGLARQAPGMRPARRPRRLRARGELLVVERKRRGGGALHRAQASRAQASRAALSGVLSACSLQVETHTWRCAARRLAVRRPAMRAARRVMRDTPSSTKPSPAAVGTTASTRRPLVREVRRTRVAREASPTRARRSGWSTTSTPPRAAAVSSGLSWGRASLRPEAIAVTSVPT